MRSLQNFEYLFADMAAEMDAIYAVDPVIAAAEAKLAEYKATRERLDVEADQLRAKVNELENEMVGLNAQLKLVTKQRNYTQGELSSNKSNCYYMDRRIEDREKVIRRRRSDLMQREGKKRLRHLGTEIRREAPLNTDAL